MDDDITYEQGMAEINALFDKYLIQLSQMVEDGKLSETSAKVVFKDLRSDHNMRVAIWDKYWLGRQGSNLHSPASKAGDYTNSSTSQ